MNATADNDLPAGLPSDLIDIKPELMIPDPYWWVPWLIGLTLLLVIFVPLFIWLLRRTKMPVAGTPPHERARARLAKAGGLMGQPEPFCVLVSHTLRVYLEERFELHAPEETTEEFLKELQSSTALASSQRELLAKFLNQCDLAKFAKHDLEETQLKSLLQFAKQIVDETAMVGGAIALPAVPPRLK